MDNKSASVIKRAQSNDKLLIVWPSDENKLPTTVIVIQRDSYRGRKGYVALRVRELVTDRVFTIYSDSGALYSSVSFVKADGSVSKPRPPRKTSSASASVESDMLRADKDRLHAENTRLQDALNVALAAQRTAENDRHYWQSQYRFVKTANPVNLNPGGKMTISENAMLFLVHAEVTKFPCTAEELKKGRTRMLLKVHPDYGGTDEKCIKAMKGYDELIKLV